jgi:hypothetical protein
VFHALALNRLLVLPVQWTSQSRERRCATGHRGSHERKRIQTRTQRDVTCSPCAKDHPQESQSCCFAVSRRRVGCLADAMAQNTRKHHKQKATRNNDETTALLRTNSNSDASLGFQSSSIVLQDVGRGRTSTEQRRNHLAGRQKSVLLFTLVDPNVHRPLRTAVQTYNNPAQITHKQRTNACGCGLLWFSSAQ